jgi:hypothetical protein
VPPEQEHRDAAAYQFVAALGGAMAAANYPVTMVGETTAATSRPYGLENQILALPNYVQVGSPTGDGLYIANPDFDLRYDQSFPLAKLVARARSGTIDPGLLAVGAGLAGVHGGHPASRCPQHRRVHRHVDRDDVDRRRRADRAAAVARGDPADVVTEPESHA